MFCEPEADVLGLTIVMRTLLTAVCRLSVSTFIDSLNRHDDNILSLYFNFDKRTTRKYLPLFITVIYQTEILIFQRIRRRIDDSEKDVAKSRLFSYVISQDATHNIACREFVVTNTRNLCIMLFCHCTKSKKHKDIFDHLSKSR